MDDSLKGLEALAQRLQTMLCPKGSSVPDLLEQDQIRLRPPESEEVMQELDRANVKLATALQSLMQVCQIFRQKHRWSRYVRAAWERVHQGGLNILELHPQAIKGVGINLSGQYRMLASTKCVSNGHACQP